MAAARITWRCASWGCLLLSTTAGNSDVAQLRHLVLHERDQRRDDYDGLPEHQRRQPVSRAICRHPWA